MRVRIVFLLKNKGAYVPFHHQYLIAQVIAQLTVDAPSEFRQFNQYNFSGLKGQTKVSKNGLHFYSSRVTLVFSCVNEAFLNFLLQRLFETRELMVGNLVLTPEMVEQEASVAFTEAVKYVCISPLVLVSPEGNDQYAKKFVTPESDVFSDLLYESTMLRLEQSGRCTPEEIASFFKFQLVPDKDYLQKIKEGEKKFARIYPVYDRGAESRQKLEIRGYTFPFTLYAAPQVQAFLYNSGLGAYTAQGFGMLDLALADLKPKPMAYALPGLLVDR